MKVKLETADFIQPSVSSGKSGANQGKIAPHFHLLLWGVPWEFEFQPERGKHYRVVENCPSPMVWRTEILVEGQFVFKHLALTDEIVEWTRRNTRN